MKNIMNVLKSEEFWKQGSENIWKNHKKSTTSSWFRYKFSRVVEATEALENIQKEEALSAQFRVPHAWRIDFMLILYTSYTYLSHILVLNFRGSTFTTKGSRMPVGIDRLPLAQALTDQGLMVRALVAPKWPGGERSR